MLPHLAARHLVPGNLAVGGLMRLGPYVLVLVALGLVVTLTGCSLFDEEPSSTTSVPNGVRLADLEPGMCYLRPENTDVRTVERTGCRKPHDAEAYAVFDLDFAADAAFPGGAEVQSLAQQGCQGRFADYVGQSYEDSEYYFSAIAPTRKSWEDRGDRRVLCSVIPAGGGRLEASVKAPAGG